QLRPRGASADPPSRQRRFPLRALCQSPRPAWRTCWPTCASRADGPWPAHPAIERRNHFGAEARSLDATAHRRQTPPFPTVSVRAVRRGELRSGSWSFLETVHEGNPYEQFLANCRALAGEKLLDPLRVASPLPFEIFDSPILALRNWFTLQHLL